jgi:hypothetical protein
LKRLKILPGAAGVIALTATIGFVGGQRETETESLMGDKLTQVRVVTRIAADESFQGSALTARPDGAAYLINIRRGGISTEVLVDDVTGKVLMS